MEEIFGLIVFFGFVFLIHSAVTLYRTSGKPNKVKEFLNDLLTVDDEE
jgi:hypothetical protein